VIRALAIVALAAGCGRDTPLSAEVVARDEFVHALAVREGRLDLWQLSSRATLVFEEGFSQTYVHAPGPPPRWVEPSRGDTATWDAVARWIGPNAHLRVRASGGDMRLRIWGHVDVARLHTRPAVTVSFDRQEVGAQVLAVDGRFSIEAVIPSAWLDGWSEVYLRLSSVHDPWRDPASLQVARVEGVEWEPVR